MGIRVCVAGATGWAGRAVTQAALADDEFTLVAALARKAAGGSVADAIGTERGEHVEIVEDIETALGASPQVLIDYTHPSVVKDHVLAAIRAGVHAVVGTSGLEADDYRDIDAAARAVGVGVIAAGNFSITAALLKHFAGLAARHVPHWEIVDYASATKPDAPSGTARELAEFLGSVTANQPGRPVDDTIGDRDARGATVAGAQVHSVRLPSYVLSVEAVFGLEGERLALRHDAGSTPAPYVEGTLLAARRVMNTQGLSRGLDRLLFG